MEVSNSVGSRAVYYDRAPDPQAVQYAAATVAPHADVQRATYTVPAGRKAFFEAALASIVRDGEPTDAGIVGGRVDFTPSGGSAQTLLRLRRQFSSAGDAAEATQSQLGMLDTGDEIAISTVDLSTGGTHEFVVSAKYVEFDA